MFAHLLIAYDGSELAEKALDLSLQLAGKHGSAVTILASTEPIETVWAQAASERSRQSRSTKSWKSAIPPRQPVPLKPLKTRLRRPALPRRAYKSATSALQMRFSMPSIS